MVKVVGQLRTEAGKNIDLFQLVKKAHTFDPFLKQSGILLSAEGALGAVQLIAPAAAGTLHPGDAAALRVLQLRPLSPEKFQLPAV